MGRGQPFGYLWSAVTTDREHYEVLNLTQPESESDTFTVERYCQFHRHFPRGCLNVLDVGCNTGRGGQILAELGTFKITGLDAVQEPDRTSPIRLCRGDPRHLDKHPPDDGSFDVVLAGEFIEHLYGKDVGPSLFEFFRVLRKGGRLLVTTLNPSGLKRHLGDASQVAS